MRLPPIAGSRPSASSDAASRRREPAIAQRPKRSPAGSTGPGLSDFSVCSAVSLSVIPDARSTVHSLSFQCAFRASLFVHSGPAFCGFLGPSFRHRPESSGAAQISRKTPGPACAGATTDARPTPIPKRLGSQQGSTRNTKARTHSNTIRGTLHCNSKGPSLYCLWGTISETQAAPTQASRVKCFSTSRKRGTRLPPIAGSRPSASSDAASRRRQPTIAQRP